ncbi:MAG: bifunctional DNA-formamidopyrimidine glycosylase/DNA-(apurinic or apyrimidinic site) lyase [Actinomycetes bacterium]
MPELPEVEVVRRGVDRHSVGREISTVQVLHPRAVRRHEGDGHELADRLLGATVISTSRRGKYFWLVLDTDDLLVIHLGMSGQVLAQPIGTVDDTHLRVRIGFGDGGHELRFVDQRTFGGVFVDVPVPAASGERGGVVPSQVAHIAPDPFDSLYDQRAVVRVIKAKSSPIKAVILDQSVVSGIGNIYADEALWRTRVNWKRPANTVSAARLGQLLDNATTVMAEALEAGGTSFDSLYVNVNGSSGYFSRSLNAYGCEGEPCPRCGTAIVRERFANRSSYRCPSCQRW